MLEVRSPRAMEGYVTSTGRPALTEDGWLLTHDLVEERGDRVVFLGRADTLINVGGAKVSPDEIESLLLTVPGVAEVRVSGAANPISGQVITADVILSPGSDKESVRRAITTRARAELAPFKVPRVIRFVDVIAHSAAGKKSR
jgi:acyl-coenzyme A synthetase/AMP-(fatty) acid ligase